MSKYLAIAFIVAIFGLIMSYQNCGQSHSLQEAADAGQALSVTGIVVQSAIENCGKLIASNADKNSMFIVRSDKFQQLLQTLPENTQVKLQGTVAENVVSNCMAGVIVNVDNMDVIGGPTTN